ncbi:MAG: glycosyltransferase family 2 protein [Planctomycetaceae bacterium]|nr:glycosyltransferase family 2 protein [Planctomycetaceae bacterium]
MVLTVQAVFWVSLCGLLYIYAGYPAFVWLCARCWPARILKESWTGPLSIVIVGHNEARRLTGKLDSLIASNRSDLISEILIGSDGSDDDTAPVIAAYPDRRVKLVSFERRRGKPAVLNDVIPHCRNHIVVLTDARQRVDPAAIGKLTAPFADPSVGVVSGELMFHSSGHSSAAAGIGAYWTYEKFIRKCESRFRSVPGATGALYAIRRDLFRPVPDNTLLDDVVIPMQAIEQGYRCILEAGAIAWDEPSQSPGQESIRKRRTIAGCAQLLINQPRWLLPWRNPVWWEFVSHKIARLASPLLLGMVLIANVWLAGHLLYAILLAAQLVFYVVALVGLMMVQRGRRSRSFGLPLMFLALNATTIAALWDAVRGRFRPTWQRAT